MSWIPSQSEIFWNCTKDCNQMHWGYCLWLRDKLVPLKSAIKPKKQMRFAGDPVTSVKAIPVRMTRPHLPKGTINAGDPDLLIPIELKQARADVNQNQDLRGNLPAVSPRESHQSEETLPTQPLGQFQVHRTDNTTTNSIAHSRINTPSQSEIFSDNNTITENILNNISPSRTVTPSQSEIFSETGTSTSSSSSKEVTHSDRHVLGSHRSNEEWI